MALPRGAMSLSAVCDCSISWSYSLFYYGYSISVLKLGVLSARFARIQKKSYE